MSKSVKKEVTVERVELFKVDSWGKGKGELKTVRALRKGKSLYVPIIMAGIYWKRRLHTTPKAAIRAAIKETKEELGGSWIKDTKAALKKLRTLLKSL